MNMTPGRGVVPSAWFADTLLEWFDVHGRKDLPWQGGSDPYRVWISEIMLQQTQVATVIPYYQRFTGHFPSVDRLADAELDEVLHLWSGLGYYARARNLHRAAQIIQKDFRGRLPEDIDTLQSLPGIGRSTAGAILALGLGRRHPILDGNVKRVLARFHAIEGWPGRPANEKRLWALAEAHTPAGRVGDYTQAIMDLGATLCSRTRPDCARCPLSAACLAYDEGRPTAYPEPRPRVTKPERRATLLLLSNDTGEILLERRPPSGIWGGLWSLPEAPHERAQKAAIARWCKEKLHCHVEGLRPLPELRHAFTHFTLTIQPLHAHARRADGVMESECHVWYNTSRSSAHGMAAPVRRLISNLPDSQEKIDDSQGPLRQAG